MIVQIFNPTGEFVTPISMPANEANVETETQLVAAKMKIVKSNMKPSILCYACHSFCFYSSQKYIFLL